VLFFLSADTHCATVMDLTSEGWLYEHSTSPIYSIPLHKHLPALEHAFHGDFDQIFKYDDTLPQKIVFTSGFKLFYGNIRVNTQAKVDPKNPAKSGPFYEFSLYSYFYYSLNPEKVFSMRRYLSETIPHTKASKDKSHSEL